MELHARIISDTLLITLTGSIDTDSAEDFQDQLLALADHHAEVCKGLVLDLGNTDFINSTGLRALLLVAKKLSSSGIALALANPLPDVKDVLNISRFDRILGIHTTVAEAISSFSTGDRTSAVETAQPESNRIMRIKFWGTRGSIPVTNRISDIRWKLREALDKAKGRVFCNDEELEHFLDSDLSFPVSGTYGGNTPCVQIDTGGDEYILCDAGTGIRLFGNQVMSSRGKSSPATFHILMSHLHWDHIMGFPLFTPAYIPGNRIHIYGCHDEMESAFRTQHSHPGFPVPFDDLEAEIDFTILNPDKSHQIAGCRVTPMLQLHTGNSYGYRFERNGRSVVYSTDSEHKHDNSREADSFAHFFRKADLVIFDSMYSLADCITIKQDWGHSSNLAGVDLCQIAEAKCLCLFHHEPAYTDQMIHQVLKETRRYEQISRNKHPLSIIAAYDGLEVSV